MNGLESNGFANRWIIAVWIALTVGLIFTLFLGSSTADRAIALNTVFLGLATASVAIPLAGILVWLMSSRGIASRLLFFLCLGLVIVPPLMYVSAWDSALGKLGWLTSTRGQPLTPLLSGWVAAIWVHALAVTPQVALIFFLGRMAMGQVFEDQARLETSAQSVFWHVTLPRMLPLILLSGIWILIGCSREIAVTDLYQIGTLAEQIYLGFSLGQLNSIGGNWSEQDLDVARTMGPLVGVVVVFWISITAILATRMAMSENWFSNEQRPFQFETAVLNPFRWWVGIPMLLLIGVVPVGNLLIRASFFVSMQSGTPVTGYSISQMMSSLYRAIVNHQESFAWTAVIALVSATFIMCFAIALVWLANRNWRFRFFLMICLAICCSIPGPLIGSWLSLFFSGTDFSFAVWLYDQTIFAPVLANGIFCFPYGALMVWFVLSKTARDAMENARIEGASSLTLLFRLGIASNKMALVGIWILVFAFCYGELSASQMVLPPGIDTIPRLTLGYLHSGVDEMTAALTIVNVVGLVSLSGIGWTAIWLNIRQRNRK